MRVVPEAPSRPQGGGRRRHGDREGLAAIVFVATSGCTWQQLPTASKNQVVTHGAGLGIDVEIVARNPQDKGFVPQPKRWRAEQTYRILILHRRLIRDYEHRPSSASRVYWAMTHVMTRRLTDANTPTWRRAQAAAT